jgi:hypothetical protein
MRKLLPLTLIALLAGCATFGIKPASYEEGREGREYKMLVRAWDKNAKDLSVVFMYRVNGGAWKDKPGVYDGSLFEATLGGNELLAGYLEYYAWMTNAKGEKISSPPVTIQVISQAQAKLRAEQDYLARLSDSGTAREFFYIEPAVFRLNVAGTAVPVAVECNIAAELGSRSLSPLSGSSGRYEISLAAPHSASSYSYQWTVKWQDPEFGDITSVFPSSPRFVQILDQAALKARIENDFRAAMRYPEPVAGSFFDPPVARARLDYSGLLGRFSAGRRQVNLALSRGGLTQMIRMSETAPGLFSVEIPVEALEQGALSYSFVYSDSFPGIDTLQAEYPAHGYLKIAYKSLEDLRSEAIAELRGKLVHQPPANAVEGAVLSLRLDALDARLQVVSISLDGAGQRSIGSNIPFIFSEGAWHAAVPGAAIRAGVSIYRITAIVRDPRLGDLKVTLPAADYYAINAKSLAQVRAEGERALAKSLSHAVPLSVARNKDLALVLTQNPAIPNSSASLHYRTADSPRYRELRAGPSGGVWAFTVSAADTLSNYIQYYFTVSAFDPALGILTATLRSEAGGVGNDFIVAPTKEASPQGEGQAGPAGDGVNGKGKQ